MQALRRTVVWEVLVFGALAAAAVVTIRDGVAWQLERMDPRLALQWKPGEPGALMARGTMLLAATIDPAAASKMPLDLKRIRPIVTAGVKASPLDGRLLRNAALAAAAEGDQARGDAIAMVSGRRSRRDPLVQAWLFDRDQIAGQREAAMVHGDAMLRHRPVVGAGMYPVFSEMALLPGGAAALAHRLELNPPWRADFFAAARKPEVRLEGLQALAEQMIAGPNRMTGEEGSGIVDRLAAVDPAQAQHLWQRLAVAQQPRGVSVSAGANTASLIGMPGTAFERGAHGWQARLPTRIARDLSPLRAFLQLPPGAYRLLAPLAGSESLPGTQWRLSCVGRKRPLAELQPTGAGGDAASAEFEVREDCRAQWLTLGGAMPSGGERRIALPFIQVVPDAASQ